MISHQEKEHGTFRWDRMGGVPCHTPSSLSPGTTGTQVKVTAVLIKEIVFHADPPSFLSLPIGSTNQHFKQATYDDPSALTDG